MGGGWGVSLLDSVSRLRANAVFLKHGLCLSVYIKDKLYFSIGR